MWHRVHADAMINTQENKSTCASPTKPGAVRRDYPEHALLFDWITLASGVQKSSVSSAQLGATVFQGSSDCKLGRDSATICLISCFSGNYDDSTAKSFTLVYSWRVWVCLAKQALSGWSVLYVHCRLVEHGR